VRVLVTGGAGFIGSHIAGALLAGEHDVLVVDDLSTGRRDNVPSGVAFVEADIRDADAMDRIVGRHRPQAITHQAAQTSVAVSVREPGRDADINVLGTITLLETAARHGVPSFVFAGTAGALYGEVPDGQRANMGWTPQPMSPYGCSKLAAEGYVRALGKAHDLRTTILRYANVYGPRQDPHGEAGVVAIFCRALLAGEPVRINARRDIGDDGCVRDYVHVGDVVAANLAALAGDLGVSTLDVCTGEGTSTRKLADRLAELIGIENPTLEPAAHRPGDLQRSVLDPAEQIRELGEPMKLDRGLRDTIAWFRDR
jgi:UDP-glucose 4-epimerase